MLYGWFRHIYLFYLFKTKYRHLFEMLSYYIYIIIIIILLLLLFFAEVQVLLGMILSEICVK